MSSGIAILVMTQTQNKGVIYIASGKRYIEEACRSAASLKQWLPNISVTLFSDQEYSSPHFENVIVFSELGSWTTDQKSPKVVYMYQSPYDYTLYLDTDTYICDDISDIFSLLEHYDIAAAHSPLRSGKTREGIPDSFPEMNSGIIAFRKSPEVKEVFSKWLELYKIDRAAWKIWYCPDQPSFRAALYGSSLKIATLPPEYNCRFIYPVYVDGKVKILHGHYGDMPAIEAEINKKTKMRCFLIGVGVVGIEDKRPLITLIQQKLAHKIRNLYKTLRF